MGINVKAIKTSQGKEAAIDQFVESSPVVEAKPKAKSVVAKKRDPHAKTYERLRGQMVQTTITMTPEDLEAINAAAKAARMTRAAFIRQAVFRVIDNK
ncbi:MAG: ribbon-helix-helix protein, CopG family [Burkholderiaceae bacterium]|nr:ribbon-helix-helix protein, CopG family [Burkholderiaceae bacterium]